MLDAGRSRDRVRRGRESDGWTRRSRPDLQPSSRAAGSVQCSGGTAAGSGRRRRDMPCSVLPIAFRFGHAGHSRSGHNVVPGPAWCARCRPRRPVSSADAHGSSSGRTRARRSLRAERFRGDPAGSGCSRSRGRSTGGDRCRAGSRLVQHREGRSGGNAACRNPCKTDPGILVFACMRRCRRSPEVAVGKKVDSDPGFIETAPATRPRKLPPIPSPARPSASGRGLRTRDSARICRSAGRPGAPCVAG